MEAACGQVAPVAHQHHQHSVYDHRHEVTPTHVIADAMVILLLSLAHQEPVDCGVSDRHRDKGNLEGGHAWLYPIHRASWQGGGVGRAALVQNIRLVEALGVDDLGAWGIRMGVHGGVGARVHGGGHGLHA